MILFTIIIYHQANIHTNVLHLINKQVRLGSLWFFLLNQSKLTVNIIYAVFLTQFSRYIRPLTGATVRLFAFITPGKLNINYWMKVLFNHFQSQVHHRPSSHCQCLHEPHQFVVQAPSLCSASCLSLHLMSYFTRVINVFYWSLATCFIWCLSF